uniref:Transcription regulator PadR N-terminal domain-containing protein n=1 Tax=Loigolactobacillus rennini TaxID=238013 RepID=A0A1K2IBB3_9LACO|nr:hypothetical protein LREN565_2114 [Loigolactobacillus rennini]
MNPQINKGVLELVLLLQLKFQDNYAYRLSKFTSNSLGVTEGAIYPVLRRLEAKGIINAYEIPHGKRIRKNYHLLPKGDAYLDKLMAQWQRTNIVITRLEKVITKNEKK